MLDQVDPCLSVVVPAYNEEATIATVLARVLATPRVGEVIVVNDCSTDDTLAALGAVADPRLRVLSQPVNLGKGAALRRGIANATQPFVVIQDADLEYNPSEYDKLLRPLLDDRADVVYGTRFGGGGERRALLFWHAVGNRVLTLASNALTNLNLTDMETCYKMFRREVIQAVTIEEDRFGFEPEITAKVAALGCRIYEVPISYDGRTYAQGKKIGWKDGMRAVYCIVRYSRLWPARDVPTLADAPPDRLEEAMGESLESLEEADNYADWIVDQFAPHLSGTVVELGAGSGTMTERLRSHAKRTVATDVSPVRVQELRARFAGFDEVEVVEGDGATVLGAGSDVDAVVMINVLEHIENDVEQLRLIREALAPGGTVAIFVPAFMGLYSDFDRAIGHHRRYTRATLATALSDAGLDVVDLRYMNQPGAFAWWLTARTLGRSPASGPLVTVFDKAVVPVVRRAEQSRAPRFGQSLVAVARKPVDVRNRAGEAGRVTLSSNGH
jgi:SAM-dependent methyltransferase